MLGLAAPSDDSNFIIAGVERGAVLRSADCSRSWQGYLKATSKDCHSITFHTKSGNWAYQGGGVWPAAVSRDGGRNWQQPLRGIGWKIYGWAVAADPADPSIWYVSATPLMRLPLFFIFPSGHWDGHAQAAIFRPTPDGDWK